MARLFRAAILMACFLSAGSAFAAGGPCPTAANYIVPTTGASATLSSLGVTNCFYISAAGADTNSGTTEASPWLHAPGMPNCASNCAAITPAPGEGFILRGGDTWHFGNSALSPYTGTMTTFGGGGSTGWKISVVGTPANPFYLGVDQTWFSGSSWTRPIMNGDNPTSSSGNLASCTFDQGRFWFIFADGDKYAFIPDDFEFTGFCWSGTQSPSSGYIYNGIQSGGANVFFHSIRNYFHGWSHVSFSSASDGATAIGLTASNENPPVGSEIAFNVWDGSDTDQCSLGMINFGGFSIHHNVFTNGGNTVVTGNTHSLHDNLFQFLNQSCQAGAHTNGYEFNSEPNTTDNVVYNNVIHDIFVKSGDSGVVQWLTPQLTDYYFNNIVYNVGTGGQGNFWDLTGSGGGGVNGWTLQAFNNTFAPPAANGNANPANTTAFMSNFHCVVPGATSSLSSCVGNSVGAVTYTTPIIQTPSVASGQGYTSARTFAFSPTASSNSTVGAGTNEQALCSNLTGSSDTWLQLAGAACKNDTTYAVSYNASNHSVVYPARTPLARPASGAWDVGAYQLSGSQVQAPQAPTNLRATVQ